MRHLKHQQLMCLFPPVTPLKGVSYRLLSLPWLPRVHSENRECTSEAIRRELNRLTLNWAADTVRNGSVRRSAKQFFLLGSNPFSERIH